MANTLLVIKNHLLLFFILLLLGLAACENEESCVTSNSNLVKVDFYRIDDTTALNLDNTFFRRVTGVFADNGQSTVVSDTIFEGLFLDPTDTTASFIFTFADGSQRIISLRYDREQSLISPECGPDQRYFNLDTISYTFDSLRIANREVGKFDGANIEIFTCQNNLYTDSIFLSFIQLDSIQRPDTLLDRSITDAQGQVLFSPDSVSRVSIPVIPNQSEITLFINQLDTATGQVTAIQNLVLSYQQEEKRSGDARQCQLQTRYYDLNIDTIRTSVDSIRFVQRELTINNPVNLEILDTIP